MSNLYPRQRLTYSRPIVQTSHWPSNWGNDSTDWRDSRVGHGIKQNTWPCGQWEAETRDRKRCCVVATYPDVAKWLLRQKKTEQLQVCWSLKEWLLRLLTARGILSNVLSVRGQRKRRDTIRAGLTRSSFAHTPKLFPVSAHWSLEFQMENWSLSWVSWY